jgi:hypothetical protein
VNINVCIDFELLEVEVPLIFLGAGCFSTCSEGRYPPSMSEIIFWATAESITFFFAIWQKKMKARDR